MYILNLLMAKSFEIVVRPRSRSPFKANVLSFLLTADQRITLVSHHCSVFPS
jgi:hypothetical protein